MWYSRPAPNMEYIPLRLYRVLWASQILCRCMHGYITVRGRVPGPTASCTRDTPPAHRNGPAAISFALFPSFPFLRFVLNPNPAQPKRVTRFGHSRHHHSSLGTSLSSPSRLDLLLIQTYFFSSRAFFFFFFLSLILFSFFNSCFSLLPSSLPSHHGRHHCRR